MARRQTRCEWLESRAGDETLGWCSFSTRKALDGGRLRVDFLSTDARPAASRRFCSSPHCPLGSDDGQRAPCRPSSAARGDSAVTGARLPVVSAPPQPDRASAAAGHTRRATPALSAPPQQPGSWACISAAQGCSAGGAATLHRHPAPPEGGRGDRPDGLVLCPAGIRTPPARRIGTLRDAHRCRWR